MSRSAVPVQQQQLQLQQKYNFFVVLVSVLLIPSITQSHPDCEKHTIEVNIFQICRSYPIHKRNTRDFNINQGFVSQNDLDTWNFVGEEPSYIGNIKDKQFSGDSPGPWQHIVWYPTVAAVGSPYPPKNPNEGSIITIEDLFDPIHYGGAEIQLPIERWRRVDGELVQEIEGFIRHQCCYRGCAYPDAYLELAQRTNLCNHF